MTALVPFASGFTTADGFPMLVGGLCPPGQQTFCISHLAQLTQLTIGTSRDCVIIDVQLSRLLHQTAPPGIRFMAASIFVPDASQLCGGVAGDLFRDETSADSMFATLDEGVFGFALPGAGAMLMVGPEHEAHQICSRAIFRLSDLPLTRSSICTFLAEASVFPGQFLFVSDGSGGSAGCMCTHSCGRQEILWLPVSQNALHFERGENRV